MILVSKGSIPFEYSFNPHTKLRVLKQCDASDDEVNEVIKQHAGDDNWIILKKDDQRSVFGVSK